MRARRRPLASRLISATLAALAAGLIGAIGLAQPAPSSAQSTPEAATPVDGPASAPASAPIAAPGDRSAACPPAPQPPSADELQSARRRARDRGLLWRIDRDGRSSYLYGTLHVGKLDWAFPGPLLSEALSATDTLAVEIDLTDPALAQSVGAGMAATASTELAPALRARLRRQFADACVDERALSRLPPLMQAITLTVLSARWEGLDAGYAQEMVLGAFARSRARPIVALETAQSQIELLTPGSSEEADRLLGQALDQLERGRVRPVLARLAMAWEGSRLDELERYPEWCECADTAEDRAFLHRLNDARNGPMADRIASLHGEGKRLLAAVGALHMLGEQGLPRLLTARGFRVVRLLPKEP